MAIDSLRAQLIRDEGMRLKPYQDSVGKLTIGCGRNLTDKGISLLEADVLLDHDITEAAAEVTAAFPWSVTGLDDVRREALINMVFNLGIGGVQKFTKALKALEVQDWTTAAKEMLDSKWAQQVGTRAQRLADQITTGVRQ